MIERRQDVSPRRGRKPTGNKREAILAAARALIAQKGYEASSVPQIARRAGVAQGTFYRYFDSKAALVDALTLSLQNELSEALRKVMMHANNHVSVVELIEDMIDAALGAVAGHSDILKFLNYEALLFGNLKVAERNRIPYELRLAELIRRDQQNGWMSKDIDPQMAATLVGAIMDRLARILLLNDSNADPTVLRSKRQRKRLVADTVRFIRRALS